MRHNDHLQSERMHGIDNMPNERLHQLITIRLLIEKNKIT